MKRDKVKRVLQDISLIALSIKIGAIVSGYNYHKKVIRKEINHQLELEEKDFALDIMKTNNFILNQKLSRQGKA